LSTSHSRPRPSRVALLALFVGLAVLESPVAHAATFTVINNDGPGEGFNDATAVAPVGGNTGTTLGAQRLIAFQRAADIWGALLSSAVTIRVNATFDPMTCNASSAILGSAGPTTAFRDFSGVPLGSTWYPGALANALHGSDLDGGAAVISAQFNSALGTTCSFPRGWYYGLDGNAGGNIDFVTVLLHELGHGLGFLTFVDLTTGAKALGSNDTFMLNLENHGASPADYPSMSNAQRVAASINSGNLHWVGPHVRASSGVLVAGAVGDHVRMFAPNPQQPGSSVSHWDTALSPNQLLEPIYTVPLDPGLELALFQDIGWTVLSLSVLLTPNPASGPSPLATTLTADVSGTATGTINYTFWWNCSDGGTSVSAVTVACGDPTNPAVGAKFNGVASTSQAAPHVYASTGTFTAKVIAERAAAPPTEMRTTIVVSGAPILQVTPATNIAAAGVQGGPFSPSAFQYQLSTTTGAASFSISGLPSWLTASATSGTATPSATTITFTVNANANALAPGVSGPATITVTNTTNGLGNATHTATLTVNVPVPALKVTPAGSIGASGLPGGPFFPSAFQYQLSTTTGTANFSISGLPPWLTASTTSGTLTTSPTTVTFTVNVTASGLALGTYGPATIGFTNTTNGQGNTVRTATLNVARALGDFDGDGRKDLAVYRPTTAEWFILGSATGFQTLVFGAPSASGLGDTPVPADYDGDGKTDMAIYRQATGEWFIFGTATGFQTRVFGAPAVSGLGDTPVPADYDGDGKVDMAIYRKATGEWFIFGTATGFQTRVFGAPAASGLGDTPVPGDYDGDGKADMAIYRKATGQWFIFGSASGFSTLVFGAPAVSGLGDTPVPMDFDGDRKTDVAIYRKATAEWFIIGSASGFRTLVFGAPAASGLGDVPVPGDFDGDGKADIAVRRSATAEWFVLQSSTGQAQTTMWGAPSDLPLPRPAQ
jgi:hypothetical protein